MKVMSVIASMVMLATSALSAQSLDVERSAVQAFEQASTAAAEAQTQPQRDEVVKKFLGVLAELKGQGLSLKEFAEALSERGLIAPGTMERLLALVKDLRQKDPDLLARWSRGDVRREELEALAEVLAGPTGSTYYIVSFTWVYYMFAAGCVYYVILW